MYPLLEFAWAANLAALPEGAHPGAWWHPESELVLLRPASTTEEFLIEPTVIGVQEFAITLFGGRKVGWYTYESSNGKILVAKGREGTARNYVSVVDRFLPAHRPQAPRVRCSHPRRP